MSSTTTQQPQAAPAAKKATAKATPKPAGSKAAAPKAPAVKAWFSNKQFLISQNGIFERTGKDNKNLNLIHPFAAIPVETLGSLEADGEVHVHVKVRIQTSRGTEQTLTIPQGDLTTFGPSSPLARSGWPIPAQSARSKVAAALLAALKAGVPSRDGFAGCGWVVAEKLHLRPGHELYTGMTPALTSVAGNPETWRQTVGAMVADSPACALAIAAAFGSYLRGVVNQAASLSHIFQIHGEHRRGKSTILSAVASIQGQPNKGIGSAVFDSATTNVGFEFLLAASNHGFLAVDEIDEILRRDGGTNRLMYLTNGGGRAKGDAFGGLHMGRTWNSTMITAGNATISSLCRGDMKEGALITRVFELDILDADLHTFTDRQAASRYLPELSANYGHGYTAAIEAITAKPDYWRSLYNEYYDELTNDNALRHFDEERRFAVFVALAQVGADLAGEVLGGDAATDCSEAVSRLIERYRRDDDDTLENADREALAKIESFKQFIADNAARFRWQGFAWTEDKLHQEGKARDLSNDAVKGGALGLIITRRPMEHSTDFEGEAILNPKGEDLMMKAAQLSSQDFALAARRFGLLKTQGDGRDHVKVNGKTKEAVGSSRALRIELREVELNPARGDGSDKPYTQFVAELGPEEGKRAYMDYLISHATPDEIAEGLELFGPPPDNDLLRMDETLREQLEK